MFVCSVSVLQMYIDFDRVLFPFSNELNLFFYSKSVRFSIEERIEIGNNPKFR